MNNSNLTVCFPFGKYFSQVNVSFPDEIRFARVIGKACNLHDFSTLNILWYPGGLWRRMRRAVGFLRRLARGVIVLKECEAYLFVPFRVLTSTLNGLGSTFLAIYGNNRVWILFPNMSLVREMVLGTLACRCISDMYRQLTALRTTTIRVPISRGLDDM